MKNLITLTTALMFTAFPAFASDFQKGLVCITDNLAKDGELSAFVFQYNFEGNPEVRIQNSRKIGRKTESRVYRIENAKCDRGLEIKYSSPAVYLPNFNCDDAERENKARSVGIEVRSDGHEMQITGKILSAMGNTASKEELVAPNNRDCNVLVGDEFTAAIAKLDAALKSKPAKKQKTYMQATEPGVASQEDLDLFGSSAQ